MRFYSGASDMQATSPGPVSTMSQVVVPAVLGVVGATGLAEISNCQGI